MSRNPYTPPSAAVADEVVPPRPMPAAVRNALFVMAASLLLHFVIDGIVLRRSGGQLPAEMRAASVIVSGIIAVGVTAWLGWKIAVGRNWARIVLLVLTILSVLGAVFDIQATLRYWPLGAGLKLVEQGMDIAVVCLLFIPGRAWFRKQSAAY